jgi:hypothetical protein
LITLEEFTASDAVLALKLTVARKAELDEISFANISFRRKTNFRTFFVSRQDRRTFKAGLPDDIFCMPKIPIWVYLKVLGIENVCKSYGHLEYYTTIWNILQQFGIFYDNLEYFTTIWNILRQFGIFYDNLEYFTTIGNILSQFAV